MTHAIALDKKRCRRANAEQMERLHNVVKWLRWSAKALRLHPDTEVSVRFRHDEDSADPDKRYRIRYDSDGRILMRLHLESADYGRYRLDVYPRCLEEKRDEVRPLDSIHECLHIRCYPYTSLAEALTPDSAEALRKAEETLVTHLEHSLALVAGLKLQPEP